VELASARGVRLAGLAVGSDVSLAARQVGQHRPSLVWTKREDLQEALCSAVGDGGLQMVSGPDRLLDFADLDAETLVVCIPSLDALELTGLWLASGRRAVVASKEILVAAGRWLNELSKTGLLVPLDSELTAAGHLFQRVEGRVRRLLLPASGGPFWGKDIEFLQSVTPTQALNHPVWHMGPKVTVDSATLVNKAFELLAAKNLFRLDAEQLDAVIHPEGIVHAMVLDETGSWIWLAGPTTMDWAVEYALFGDSDLPVMDPAGLDIRFDRVTEPFDRALKVARHVMESADLAAACMVGADDFAVEAFLAGDLTLPSIWDLLDRVVHEPLFLEGETHAEMIRIRQAFDLGWRKAAKLLS